ncbi:class I SAM-dependent methyltransferase [Nocardiopsis eucommiae]|uniref:Class I SAM-dependent methyltransferase n=1 Tax=Nocardiopsis eucommiae TaxID=2831970 RepID=A0A975QHZ6_9ACTN|nr:class I SAM-dependent methyltransferase [Nocardiopsis eucommiae]
MTPLFDTPATKPETIHPFSVLRADVGKWQDRKRAWNALGFNSRAGREHAKTWSTTGGDNVSQKLGKISDGLSTFDPVLAELSYDWYTPANGHILDPFAGGSVRGLVAGHGGYQYTGIDLSQKQVDANRPQIDAWHERGLIDTETRVEYIVGDAADVTPTLPDDHFDYVFTCPPYHNLEVYSDLPEDLSNMAWADFEDAYTQIITETIRALRPNRFATWVVGEVRDYRGWSAGSPR